MVERVSECMSVVVTGLIIMLQLVAIAVAIIVNS